MQIIFKAICKSKTIIFSIYLPRVIVKYFNVIIDNLEEAYEKL